MPKVLDSLVAVRQSKGLDPRTKILLVVLVSAVVMGPGGLRFVPGAVLLAVALAATERAWRRLLALPVLACLLWVVGWMVPTWWANPVTAIASLACAYLLRFVAAIGVGMHVIATTSPTQLSAALRSSRVPRPVAVTLAVVVRFFPVVANEAAAVRDAMRLRGLASPAGLLRHPILSIERFTVPMIAASLRAGDDLSASAILRGLGSYRVPTALHPPRFGPPDLLLLAALAATAVLSILLPEPLA